MHQYLVQLLIEADESMDPSLWDWDGMINGETCLVFTPVTLLSVVVLPDDEAAVQNSKE